MTARSDYSDGANRWRSRITWALAFLILIPSLLGFGDKLLEFIHVYQSKTDSAFAVAPLVNYLLASAGFLMAFLWAIFNGMLNDVEGPKRTMLDNEERLDRRSPSTR